MDTKKNGITLVALVITIIVLLILAGVSISLVIGDNGIVSKTTKAKRDTVLEQAKEQIRLSIEAAQVDGEGSIYYDDLVTELNNQIGAGNYSISDESEDEWEIVVVTSEGDVTETVFNNSLSETIQFMFLDSSYEVARGTTWAEWIEEGPEGYAGPENETTRLIEFNGEPYVVFIRNSTGYLSIIHAYSENIDEIKSRFDIISYNGVDEASNLNINGSDTINNKKYLLAED